MKIYLPTKNISSSLVYENIVGKNFNKTRNFEDENIPCKYKPLIIEANSRDRLRPFVSTTLNDKTNDERMIINVKEEAGR